MEEPQVLERLVVWAGDRSDIRAVILTSSRARADGSADALSDYDVILVAVDAEPFGRDHAWLSGFDRPLVRWGDESELCDLRLYHRLVAYENGVRIDYTIWSVELLEKVADLETLPDALDVGYRVLLDKDGRTSRLRAPTFRAHIPSRPTEEEYQALVEEFWFETESVAKSLWRDDIAFAKWVLDDDIRSNSVRRLLEWRIELDHDWSLRPGVLGRGLKRLLPAAIWSELEATYVGADVEENWEALFGLAALFRRVAIEVGQRLGFTYPQEVDDGMIAQLRSVRDLPPP